MTNLLNYILSLLFFLSGIIILIISLIAVCEIVYFFLLTGAFILTTTIFWANFMMFTIIGIICILASRVVFKEIKR